MIKDIDPFELIRDNQKKKLAQQGGLHKQIPFKYSHFYDKLKMKTHTTIRRSKHKRTVRGIVDEIGPDGKVINISQITAIQKLTLDELPLNVLKKDTAPYGGTRKEIYKGFQSFYEKRIDFKKQKWFIFHLKILVSYNERR